VAQSCAQEPVLTAAAQFIQQHWLLILGVSAGILIPCFWHKHIEAGDLGSHVYNAWLAELVRRGQLPGLWIAHQWNNVAFDLLLSLLAKVFGWLWAEKLAVCLCVLSFFWGVFALVSAATGRAPVFLIPLIAMISYGWTFEQGFINYYLSLGLSFFGLAILWRGGGKERLVLLAFVPLIVLAHPLGLVWLAAAGAYLLVAERLRGYRTFLFAGAIVLVVVIGWYVRQHFYVYQARHALYLYNGADQIVLFSRVYELLAVATFSFVLVALGTELWKRRKEPEFREIGSILLQLYLILQCSVLVLPYGILLPEYKAPLSFLPHRLTTLSAVVICCLLGLTLPRRWHLMACSAAAIMFFALLYKDTGIINSMEEQSERLVAGLPFGQRVLFTVKNRGLRLFIAHFTDRSCINHCFSYGNYEPSTGQFRIRANPGNGFVTTEFSSVTQMENGQYRVKSSELPIFEIYQCGLHGRELCGRPMAAGETNNQPSDSEESPFGARLSEMARQK
jgi:hypothetical protein